MISMNEFGRRVAAVQDEIVAARNGDDDLAMARLRLFDNEEYLAPQRTAWTARRTAGIVALAAAAVLAVSLAGVFGLKDNTTDTPSAAQTEGDVWISAPSDLSRDVSFLDGSLVTLQPATDARVLSRTHHGAHVVIENGSALINVKHHADTDWTVDVGPYRVKVIGTVFMVSWNSTTKEFRLSLEEGSVLVKGPMMEDGRTVQERETLIASVADRRLEILAGRSVDTEAGVSVEMPSRDEDNVSSDAQDESRPRSNSVADPRRPPQVSWQQLNREGQFARVIEEASAPGLARTLNARPASDLLALADASRLMKDWDGSKQAYLSVRRRFPQTESAAVAGYSLGRMAFDNQKDYAAAVKWLETYLSENSRGPLAREALGRLMEARDRLGNLVGAKSAAVEYLSRYPQGPHARLAQTLVNRP